MADPIRTRAGLFVPTTSVWDVQRVEDVDVNSEEFKELLVRLYQNINNIVLALNAKDSAYYDQQEFINGQLFFPNSTQTQQYRQVIRKVINFGSLPNNTTASVAHGITINPNTTFTRIYGTSTNNTQTSFIPIPYVSNLGYNIALEITETDIFISTNLDYSSYTTTYVILEFLQT